MSLFARPQPKQAFSFFPALQVLCGPGRVEPLDLTEADPRLRLEALAKKLEVRSDQVAYLKRITRVREGVEMDCLGISTLYNEAMIALLRETGEARFARARRTWTLPMTRVDETFLQELTSIYGGLVDEDAGLLCKSPAKALRSSAPPSFDLLPEAIGVDPAEILAAYARARPLDQITLKHSAIFENGFEPVPADRFATRFPLLLLRITVEQGQPRYVTWSALTGEIETLVFATEKRKLARLLARYSGAVRDLGQPVQMGRQAAKTTANLPDLLRSTAQRLELPMACIEEITAALPDAGLVVAPQSWSADLAAPSGGRRDFVAWSGSKLGSGHLAKLGSFLSRGVARRVILFSEEVLSRIASGKTPAQTVKARILEELARDLSQQVGKRVPGDSGLREGISYFLTLMLLDQVVNASRSAAHIGGEFLQRARAAGLPAPRAQGLMKDLLHARRYWDDAPDGAYPASAEGIVRSVRYSIETGLADGLWAVPAR